MKKKTTTEKKHKLKTFIRWPGNKSRHINKIRPYLPNPDEYNRYIEPFLGSGAMFLTLQPKKFIVNDINKDCINCWKSVRDDPKYVIKEIKIFGKKFKPLCKEDKVDWCKEITLNIEEQSYDKNRAVDYILMNYCVYMGRLIRDGNMKFYGLCNKIDKFHFLQNKYFDNIGNISKILTNKTIYCTDYKKILDRTKEGDFVFLDPPYIQENYQFKYNKNEKLDETFLSELEQELGKLDKKGVLWLMTQADTLTVKKKFGKYTIRKFQVYRNHKQSYENELIIMNY